MKLDYIEPFMASAVSVLAAVLHTDMKRGTIALVRGHELAGDVAVVIGLREQPGESVILNMDTGTALRICAAMNGYALDTPDEDALGELANMIAGNAVSSLDGQDTQFSVRPPVAVNRGDLPRFTGGLELFQVPVTSEHGTISVNFSVRTCS